MEQAPCSTPTLPPVTSHRLSIPGRMLACCGVGLPVDGPLARVTPVPDAALGSTRTRCLAPGEVEPRVPVRSLPPSPVLRALQPD